MNEFSESQGNSEELKTPTVKEIYASSLGKNVSLDFFLFATFEEGQTIKHLSEAAKNQLNLKRWKHIQPYLESLDFLEEGASRPVSETIESSELCDLIPKLFEWYQSHHPSLAANAPLDYEVYGSISKDIALLVQDLELLLKIKLKNPLQPRHSECSESSTIWTTTEEQLKKHFPNYSEYFISYFEWIYKRSKTEELDLSSVPPVGRYAMLIQRSLRNKNQSSRASHNGQSKDQLGTRGQKRNFLTDKKDLKNFKKDKDDSEKEAVKEAKEGIEHLEKNPKLDHVDLAARNSFIRRLQHQYIVDAGFKSESAGEGSERRVRIKRL